MGLFNKIIGVGASKNDVKVAKLELEKEKLAQKRAGLEGKDLANQASMEEAKNYLNFAIKKYSLFSKTVNALVESTNEILAFVKSKENEKLGLKDKGEVRRKREEASNNIKYLYMIREFFGILTKMSHGLLLKTDDYSFVIKFSPYFDGKKVLDELDDDDNDSIAGEFKSMWGEIKEEIVGKKKENRKFSFEHYVENYYDEIDKLVMPSLTETLAGFEESVNEKKVTQTTKVDNSSTTGICKCSYCGASINEGIKFCPECGNKVEAAKPAFCVECGSEIKPGVKFCPECGHKAK
jgi:hypothetical protein